MTAPSDTAARPPADPDRLLTVPEVGCRLRISTAKAWQLIRRGKIRSLKIDTSRRVTPQTLADYIAELEAASSAGAA